MTVLVIAATDSSGGAGLTRDAVVANELGEPVVFAATAVTAQTHDAVERVQPMDAALVAAQIAAAVATTSIDAVKIGLVPSAAVIEAIAQSLKQHKLSQVVLDPIMVASSGDRLIADGPLDILGPLLPLVRLVTPNLPELVQLCGEGSPLENARLLQSRGAVAVLVKGGHGGKPTVTDWLIEDQVEAADRTATAGSTPRHRLHALYGDRSASEPQEDTSPSLCACTLLRGEEARFGRSVSRDGSWRQSTRVDCAHRRARNRRVGPRLRGRALCDVGMSPVTGLWLSHFSNRGSRFSGALFAPTQAVAMRPRLVASILSFALIGGRAVLLGRSRHLATWSTWGCCISSHAR